MTSARVDYAWYRSGPIESTVTYSYYQTVNTNSGVGSFNIQDHLGGLSGVYRGTIGTVPYEVGGQYSYDYMFLDFTGFLSRHSLTLPVTLVPPAVTLPVVGRMENLTTLLYRYQRKEFYAEPGNNDIRFGVTGCFQQYGRVSPCLPISAGQIHCPGGLSARYRRR
ncbi:MAG: hypothetical protein HY348_07605 [Nitrospira defluvii]|nr:hypothetical protein [Nitrospira defluvii]